MRDVADVFATIREKTLGRIEAANREGSTIEGNLPARARFDVRGRGHEEKGGLARELS